MAILACKRFIPMTSVAFYGRYLSAQSKYSAGSHPEYRIIQGIFPKAILSRITESLKDKAQLFYEVNRFGLLPIVRGDVFFSSDHELIDHLERLHAFGISDPDLIEFYRIAINRFAKELKLSGESFIHVQSTRSAPPSGFSLFQPWHYDQRASYTMTSVLYNDFEYSEGKGLDLSFNRMYGPFSYSESPRRDFSDIEPDSFYNRVSIPYPKNGAILFSGKRGHVIHRMSTLERKFFLTKEKNPQRITIQIFLIDKEWGSRASSA